MCTNCVATIHRRSFLGGAAALMALGTSRRANADAAHPQISLTPDEVLKRLAEGNARYAANTIEQKDFSANRAQHAKSQSPVAAVLSCADSRVAPERIFDQGTGDLFVVRVAGNVANNDCLASLEYTVRFLNTPLILVLGHSACGAVDSAIKTMKQQASLPGHLPTLISQITPAVTRGAKRDGNLLDNAIEENVKLNAQKIARAPLLSQAIKSKQIKIASGVYDIASGEVRMIAA